MKRDLSSRRSEKFTGEFKRLDEQTLERARLTLNPRETRRVATRFLVSVAVVMAVMSVVIYGVSDSSPVTGAFSLVFLLAGSVAALLSALAWLFQSAPYLYVRFDEPREFRLGGPVRAACDIGRYDRRRLRSLRVVLEGREVVRCSESPETKKPGELTHLFFQKEVLFSHIEGDSSSSLPLLSFTLPGHEFPPTFRAPHHSLIWCIKVVGEVLDGEPLEREFEINVMAK